MDESRFDQLLKRFATIAGRRERNASPTRRTVMGLTLGGVLGPFLGLADSWAKKKKHKKKKKCKGGKWKCGKKCIPAANCCTNADCGSGGATCQGGTCLCPTGQIDCDGTCIPDDDCCPACTGGQICEGGECACPEGAFTCGNTCVDGDECCTDADCDGNLECANGFCGCGGTICVSDVCCHYDEGEVCFPGGATCLDGCPTTDYCSDSNFYFCGAGCD